VESISDLDPEPALFPVFSAVKRHPLINQYWLLFDHSVSASLAVCLATRRVEEIRMVTITQSFLGMNIRSRLLDLKKRIAHIVSV
jgi:hypothetical protein